MHRSLLSTFMIDVPSADLDATVAFWSGALGATPTSVFWLVMKQGGLLAAIGTVIGLATAYLSGQVVANQVYAVRASDPLMLTAAIVVVGGIAALATMLPAWRASKLSPARALHPE